MLDLVLLAPHVFPFVSCSFESNRCLGYEAYHRDMSRMNPECPDSDDVLLREEPDEEEEDEEEDEGNGKEDNDDDDGYSE